MKIAAALLILYGTFMAWAYLASDGMIFLPPPSYGEKEDLLLLPTAAGTTVAAYYLACPAASYTILLSHGNAEDLSTVRMELADYCRQGFSVLAYDYSGYGRSTGRPSEEAVYGDITAVYGFLVEKMGIRPERIILLGRSLGAGPSVELATKRPVGGLILESAFVSAFRVLTGLPLLPFDKFNNLAKIDKVSCPVLVIHGEKDSIVPFWHGERLFQKAKVPKMHYWVAGADHNDLRVVAGPGYWQALEGFRDLIARNAP
jgi:fermentation-respiration switch protein FrsA (DUF1100 family)